jgi:hypothetical protein
VLHRPVPFAEFFSARYIHTDTAPVKPPPDPGL